MSKLKSLNLFLCLILLVFASVAQKRTNNIVMLMPFCSKQILTNPNHSDAQLGNLSREYYQGGLIAIDSLERAKVPVRLSVFDTENDSMIMVNILKKTQLKDAELILGPVMQGGNKVLTDFVKGKDIYHVSPLMTFSRTKLVDPSWISANPDLPSYGKLLYQYIRDRNKDSVNIIIISDKSSLDKTISASLKQANLANKSIKIRTVDFVKGMSLETYLSKTLYNHIIIPTTSENVVNGTIRGIKDTALFSNVTVYGFPQWLEFKNPNYVAWQQANVQIASPFFVNHDRQDVKAFIIAYREKFYTEPSEAAYKGYDQMLYFAAMLNEHGKKFGKKMEGEPQEVLHTTFDFRKQDDKGGYQNYYINWIGIREFKFVKLN
jgi:hypothetical protein